MRRSLLAAVAVALVALGLAVPDAGALKRSDDVLVRSAEKHDVSPAVRTLPEDRRASPQTYLIPEHERPRLIGVEGDSTDPVVQRHAPTNAPQKRMPSSTDFDGIPFTGALPPDTNGDVGPNHYVQAVNVKFAIFNKSGTELQGPTSVKALWSGFGGNCQNDNDGDPVVLYDPLADRWVMSQFANASSVTGPYYECVAVSTGPDPLGTWYRYAFQTPSNRFPDYPKLGVWPDGYYMTANEFSGSGSFIGVGMYAFDRSKMLNGQNATFLYNHLGTSYFGLLPADLDGTTPPAPGDPAIFAMAEDTSSGGGNDTLRLWEFDSNFAGASASVTGPSNISVAAFDAGLCSSSPYNCVPQSGTTRKLDPLADVLMFRMAYRNLGSHESIVLSHTVDAGSDRAAPRWYELRSTGGAWTVYQQGTYSPDTTHRWMQSIAMDQDGNIAMGYSASSTSIFPSMRYVGRLTTDTLGTFGQSESVMQAGGGSQTDASGRWGDYAALSVDPSDDCTFWFTSEYYSSSSAGNWKTRIGHFTFPSCGTPASPTFSINNVSVNEGDAGTTSATFTVSLSPTAGSTETVDYTTANDSATTADNDFVTKTGTLTFGSGVSSQAVTVDVNGDMTDEGSEQFFVNLSNASGGATIGDGQGVGTIVNDDTAGGGGCDITGTSGDDELIGTGADETLCGLGGDDILRGNGGNDTLDGDGGYDVGVFDTAPSGVNVNLAAGTASGGAGSDTLISIEDVAGSAFADTLTGDATENFFYGLGGNDAFDGAGGFDRVVYWNAPSGVTVKLKVGTATGGEGSDSLTSVEDIIGSGFSDVLIGAGGSNFIYAGGGNDAVKGKSGPDDLFGEAGNDSFNGGKGTDRCVQGGGSGPKRRCELGTYQGSDATREPWIAP